MAKTTDFLSQTSGKLTDQFVTRQTAYGTILARAPRKTSNPRRSEKQANMRCQMANMSANFKLYQGKLKLAWEGKKAGLSEFNCFVASNYDKAPVYITKSMRVAGACVLAESYISSGSLPPIENTVNGEGFMVSDLRLGSLQIGAETTVADLTIAILQNNEEWEDGDQLTWFYGVQRVDSAGTPRASLTAEKVVLDTTDETGLMSVVTGRGFSSVAAAGGSGYVLGMSEVLENAGGVWVHSREKDSGSIRVSSQQMKVVSGVLGQYQTYQAMVESAKSYGGINGSVAYLKPVTLATISSGASAGSGGGSQSSSANQNANENQNGGSGTGSGSESGTGTSGSGTESGGTESGGSTTGGSGSESGGTTGGSGSGTESGGSGSGSGSDNTGGGENTGGGSGTGGSGGEDEPGGDDH